MERVNKFGLQVSDCEIRLVVADFGGEKKTMVGVVDTNQNYVSIEDPYELCLSEEELVQSPFFPDDVPHTNGCILEIHNQRVHYISTIPDHLLKSYKEWTSKGS